VDTGSAKESNVVHSRLKTELVGSASISIEAHPSLYINGFGAKILSLCSTRIVICLSATELALYQRDFQRKTRLGWCSATSIPISLSGVKAAWSITEGKIVEEKEILRLSGLVLGSPFPLLLSPLKLLGVGIPIRE
jgi:hypothetical protein